MRLVNPSFKILPHVEYPVMLKLVTSAVAHCYKAAEPADQKGREEFIRKRIKAGHDSVIEHVGFSVDFTVDRGISHELVRHRLCSFTQESTRYCNYSKDKFLGHVTFVMPPFIQDMPHVGPLPEDCYSIFLGNGKEEPVFALVPEGRTVDQFHINITNPAAQLWLVAMEQAEKNYMVAVAEDSSTTMPVEIARGILPNATKTEITVTANMREWRHIFRLRAIGTNGRPHPQMLEVMLPLLSEAQRRFPVFFENLLN